MNKISLTYEEIHADVLALVNKLVGQQWDSIYAIPRGGVTIGVYLSCITGRPLVETPTANSLIVDDLIDSGKTLKPYLDQNYLCAVLYRKNHSPDVDNLFAVRELDGWIELPYEETEADEEALVVRLLEVLGENPNREGLQDTPKRYIKFMKQFLSPEEFTFTTFDKEAYDEMIIQKDIPFFSLCEHHLAPFFGTATVAYVPKDKIVGLSKLARTVKYYAAHLQNQERITSQVADKLNEELDPLGVAVTLKARHFCMEMRGVKTHNVETITTRVTGVLKDKPEARAEYMASL